MPKDAKFRFGSVGSFAIRPRWVHAGLAVPGAETSGGAAAARACRGTGATVVCSRAIAAVGVGSRFRGQDVDCCGVALSRIEWLVKPGRVRLFTRARISRIDFVEVPNLWVPRTMAGCVAVVVARAE